MVVWHPESPGVKIVVYRNWFQRLIYPNEFATLSETIDHIWKEYEPPESELVDPKELIDNIHKN